MEGWELRSEGVGGWGRNMWYGGWWWMVVVGGGGGVRGVEGGGAE